MLARLLGKDASAASDGMHQHQQTVLLSLLSEVVPAVFAEAMPELPPLFPLRLRQMQQLETEPLSSLQSDSAAAGSVPPPRCRCELRRTVALCLGEAFDRMKPSAWLSAATALPPPTMAAGAVAAASCAGDSSLLLYVLDEPLISHCLLLMQADASRGPLAAQLAVEQRSNNARRDRGEACKVTCSAAAAAAADMMRLSHGRLLLLHSRAAMACLLRLLGGAGTSSASRSSSSHASRSSSNASRSTSSDMLEVVTDLEWEAAATGSAGLITPLSIASAAAGVMGSDLSVPWQEELLPSLLQQQQQQHKLVMTVWRSFALSALQQIGELLLHAVQVASGDLRASVRRAALGVLHACATRRASLLQLSSGNGISILLPQALVDSAPCVRELLSDAAPLVRQQALRVARSCAAAAPLGETARCCRSLLIEALGATPDHAATKAFVTGALAADVVSCLVNKSHDAEAPPNTDVDEGVAARVQTPPPHPGRRSLENCSNSPLAASAAARARGACSAFSALNLRRAVRLLAGLCAVAREHLETSLVPLLLPRVHYLLQSQQQALQQRTLQDLAATLLEACLNEYLKCCFGETEDQRKGQQQEGDALLKPAAPGSALLQLAEELGAFCPHPLLLQAGTRLLCQVSVQLQQEDVRDSLLDLFAVSLALIYSMKDRIHELQHQEQHRHHPSQRGELQHEAEKTPLVSMLQALQFASWAVACLAAGLRMHRVPQGGAAAAAEPQHASAFPAVALQPKLSPTTLTSSRAAAAAKETFDIEHCVFHLLCDVLALLQEKGAMTAVAWQSICCFLQAAPSFLGSPRLAARLTAAIAAATAAGPSQLPRVEPRRAYKTVGRVDTTDLPAALQALYGLVKALQREDASSADARHAAAVTAPAEAATSSVCDALHGLALQVGPLLEVLIPRQQLQGQRRQAAWASVSCTTATLILLLTRTLQQLGLVYHSEMLPQTAALLFSSSKTVARAASLLLKETLSGSAAAPSAAGRLQECLDSAALIVDGLSCLAARLPPSCSGAVHAAASGADAAATAACISAWIDGLPPSLAGIATDAAVTPWLSRTSPHLLPLLPAAFAALLHLRLAADLRAALLRGFRVSDRPGGESDSAGSAAAAAREELDSSASDTGDLAGSGSRAFPEQQEHASGWQQLHGAEPGRAVQLVSSEHLAMTRRMRKAFSTVQLQLSAEDTRDRLIRELVDAAVCFESELRLWEDNAQRLASAPLHVQQQRGGGAGKGPRWQKRRQLHQAESSAPTCRRRKRRRFGIRKGEDPRDSDWARDEETSDITAESDEDFEAAF
ncbi:hypothetical protein cyc_01754 [Cyclospora cayetanensis]|uniref:Uncharacterized protein n=1 Tax=Cyclospora cayetanensis TaxID=88456 RepID=A0A1D3D237_9EIME|nr:hypothetical protein cyc_01754 [Cyclospora cayetanensis]